VVHYRSYKENSMKAIVCQGYGSPDVLELEEIDRPIAADDQVLVRVQAASVNPVDWHRMRGLPNFMRAGEGLAKPKNPGLGADVAGRVEAVGGNVRQFQPGDEVFGMSIRTLAEYVCVSDQGVVPKPANLTFEQAAAVPVAAITGLQGLRDKGRIEAGHKVLVNVGAGDGRSSLRIMARMLNALVVSRFGRQKLVPLMARRNKDDLIVLKELIEAGKVTPVIDRSYPLREVPDAIQYLEEGHARGKVVITV
jgi:NADPH:quinone reductase-like Zn-dependent oxidoreductase